MAAIKLLVCLLLSNCAPPPTSHVKVLQITGFEKQVMAFEEASTVTHNKQLIIEDLIIKFDDTLLSQNEAGLCHGGTLTTTPTISISTQIWATATDDIKELLLFHELGHCILHRIQHRNDFYENGYPVSIMYFSISGFKSYDAQVFYENHRGAYINELFNYGGT